MPHTYRTGLIQGLITGFAVTVIVLNILYRLFP